MTRKTLTLTALAGLATLTVSACGGVDADSESAPAATQQPAVTEPANPTPTLAASPTETPQPEVVEADTPEDIVEGIIEADKALEAEYESRVAPFFEEVERFMTVLAPMETMSAEDAGTYILDMDPANGWRSADIVPAGEAMREYAEAWTWLLVDEFSDESLWNEDGTMNASPEVEAWHNAASMLSSETWTLGDLVANEAGFIAFGDEWAVADVMDSVMSYSEEYKAATEALGFDA